MRSSSIPSARVVLCALGLPLLAAACSAPGGAPSLPTAPRPAIEDLCGRFQWNARIVTVTTYCPATGSVANAAHDGLGRVVSFDFDMQCTADGAERLTGSVFDMTYDDTGRLAGFGAVINGQSCRFP